MKKNTDFLNTPFEDHEREKLLLCDDGYLDYDYLRYSVVKPGIYCSRIINAESSVTAKGEPSIDVYYTLVSADDYHSWNSCDSDEITYYHVKQRYKIGSNAYNNFIRAMRNAGLNKQFYTDDVIGIIEAVEVEYPNGGDMGTLGSRKPFNDDGYIFTFDKELTGE